MSEQDTIAEENAANDVNPVEVIEVVDLVEVVDVVDVKPIAEVTTEAVAETQEAIEAAVEKPVAEAQAEVEAAVETAVAEPVAEVEAAVEAAVAEPVAEAKEAVEAAVAEPVAEAQAEVEAAVAEPVAEAQAEVEAAVAEPVAEAQAEVEAAIAEPVAEAPVAKAKEEAKEADAAKETSEEDDDKKVVRVLSVGQEVNGRVKRIADFGAFVDIGVGRDGLLHISELSVNRVGKVGDVLKQGQEVKGWIKELDRDRNRISLTLISPDTKTIRELKKDDIVEGSVSRLESYGAFIDIGIGRDALLHVREMSSGYVKHPGDIVKVGEKLEARIIEISRRRSRVDLSIKGLRPEPELEEAVAEEAVAEEAAAEAVHDPYENVEILSPMELAFKKAMGDTGDNDVKQPKSKRSKSAKRARREALQEEILDRTLKNARS